MDFPGGNPFEDLTQQQLTAWIAAVKGKYEVGPNDDLLNPDGTDGIDVHIDAGVDAPPGFETSIGDWGGGGTGCTSNDKGICRDPGMASYRRTYYHYALALAAGGNGAGGIFDWGFGASGNADTFDYPGYTPPDLDTWPWYYGNLPQQYGNRDVNWDRTSGFASGWRRFSVRTGGLTDCWTLFGEGDIWRTWLSRDQTWSGSPEIVWAPGDWLYVFWVENGHLYYKVGNTGGYLNGSCPLGDEPNSGCLTFSEQFPVVSFSGIADVAVAEWDGLLYILYRYGTQAMWLRSATINPSNGQLSVSASSTSMGSSTLPPELVQLNVDSSVEPLQRRLAAIYRPSGGFEFKFRWTADPPSRVWASAQPVKDSTNTVLAGHHPPSAVPWPSADPDPYIYYDDPTTCAVFPDTTNRVRFYCLDRDDPQLRWVEADVDFLDETGQTLYTSTDVSLTYRYIRRETGARVSPGYDFGMFFLTYGHSVTGASAYYFGDELDFINKPLSGNWDFVFSGYMRNRWLLPVGGSAAVVYDHTQLGATKGAVFEHLGTRWNELQFHPLADGTWDVDLHSESDWRIMGDGMCRQLRADDYCGTFDETVWGY